MTLMKSLPMTYNRDMQEDKEPLFDTANTLRACLDIYGRMMPAVTVNRGPMAASCETGYLNATDLADYLAVRGMPFREAHSVSGRAVAHALSLGRELQDLSLDELRAFSPLFDQDVHDFLSVKTMVSRRNIHGGTAFDNVRKAVEKAAGELDAPA
jgi:argininosuccinate lyase